ncbi:MAG: diadenylate cyclase, partial [Candidatus Margulisiibacteriota bacterium]
RHIVKAVAQMAEEKMGALIVIERASGLNEYLESGIKVDAILSAEILLSIFNLKSPLHDGAVVIQGERVAAAGCLLPISDSRLIEKRVGTRHRAAVGLSEISDAIIIVVSEKTGTVSMAENGYLTRHLTREALEEKLFSLYKVEKGKAEFPWKRSEK